MSPNFQLLLLSCIVSVAIHAQEAPPLNIGDPAPSLHVLEWIKGEPVPRFEKGRVYVVELWATWCKPCIAAMPGLSALARRYQDKVTVLGLDVDKIETTSLEKMRAFVDSLGERMDYPAAVTNSEQTMSDWLEASGEEGIPKTFVVDAKGRLAWIGHPYELGTVLKEVVNNTWDIKDALTKRNFNRHLEYLDTEAYFKLLNYAGDRHKPGDWDKPDSALLVIGKMVNSVPDLKYAPHIAFHTFASLLKTKAYEAAYEYGKTMMVTRTYTYPMPKVLIGAIDMYATELHLPAAIYRLGAEACQAQIDLILYPEIADISRLYQKMGDMYWRAYEIASTK